MFEWGAYCWGPEKVGGPETEAWSLGCWGQRRESLIDGHVLGETCSQLWFPLISIFYLPNHQLSMDNLLFIIFIKYF